MQKLPTTIYDFIVQEENNYMLPTAIIEDYEWSMKDHIKTSVFYKNSQFTRGNSESERDNKPFKNIIRPILNLQYRTEGFDVKDVDIYVDDASNQHKSLLIKKYHDKWARENKIDTFIDELVESYVDFGGALVKNVNKVRPEVVPLQSIVLCDQTDILSGPIGIKHFYSPDQLKDMEEYGWGDEANGATHSVDEAILFSEQSKEVNKSQSNLARTPGKYIEVYEIHGTLPTRYLKDEIEDGVDEAYTKQMQIVCFYHGESGASQGITLFRTEEKELPFKFISRDEIFGRTLGFGGAEELFEAQVWTNYSEIRKKDMLDSASKTILKTTDSAFATRNKVQNMENLEIAVLEEGKDIGQVDTYPRNISLFDKAVMDWEEHARTMGAAQDPIMGEEPKSGTPFRLQALVTQQAQGQHEYRKGKLATFVEEIYREWILPYISKEIVKGKSFMVTLEFDELQQIVKKIVTNRVNRSVIDKILDGDLIDPQEINTLKEVTRELFMRDNNKFFEILKDEMKGLAVDVKVSIAGKQKDLPGVVDKLSSVWGTIMKFPQVLQNPSMANLFNQIIEYSGLNPVDFSGFEGQPIQAPQAPQGPPQAQPVQTL